MIALKSKDERLKYIHIVISINIHFAPEIYFETTTVNPEIVSPELAECSDRHFSKTELI